MGPGLILLIPVIQQMVRLDLRTVVLDVPPQDVITRKAVIQVANYLMPMDLLRQLLEAKKP